MSELARKAAQNQLDAYNAHDLESFVDCYSEDVEVRDLKSNELMGTGRDHLRESYGAMFQRYPNVHAKVSTRTVVDNVVFDHEVVTGRHEVLLVMAIYQVTDEGLISHVWFVR